MPSVARSAKIRFSTGSFLHEMLAFTMDELAILLLGRGDLDHAANLKVASQMGGEHTKEALEIETICLPPPWSSVNKNAGRFDDIGRKILRSQKPIKPESILSSFKVAGERRRGRDAAS